MTFKQKIQSLRPISIYLVSFFLVYVSEYMINQSTNAVIDFEGAYEGYFYEFSQFAYQLGVFLSRSSLPLFKLPSYLVPVPSALQFLFLVLYCFEAEYTFINNFWVMMVLTFVEGLFGGLVYISGMYWVSVLSNKKTKEFRMSISSLFNTAGVVLASCIGMWLEPFLEKHKVW